MCSIVHSLAFRYCMQHIRFLTNLVYFLMQQTLNELITTLCQIQSLQDAKNMLKQSMHMVYLLSHILQVPQKVKPLLSA